MYKVMLIDDNRLAIEGIVRNIDWEELHAEITHKVYDGEEALSILEQTSVDLIISDIEMPQINGLEMAERVLSENPAVKIILISAFDKFEYAQQAVHLGAFDYIEKPLDYNYLKNIIQKALHTLEQEQRNLEILKQSKPAMTDNFFSKLILSSSDEAYYLLSNYTDYLNLHVDYRYFQVAVIQIENASDIKSKFGIDKYHIHLMWLSDKIKELFQSSFSLVYTLSSFTEIILLLGHNYSGSKYFQSVSSGLFTTLTECCQREILDINIGIGTIVKDLYKVSLSYENASHALEYSFFFPQKNIFDIRDTMGKGIPVEQSFTTHEEELIRLICKKDIPAIQSWIQLFASSILENYQSKQFLFIQIYQLLGRLLKFLYEMDIDATKTEHEILQTYSQIDSFANSTEIFDWLFQLCTSICQKLEQSQQNHHAHICVTVINYISTHFQDSTLCLNDIADYVNVSPAHLSALFKKTKNQNISDFITNIRLENACQMLRTSGLSLKEVSAKVGYSNQYYFSSCFKKKFGITPSVYREQSTQN